MENPLIRNDDPSYKPPLSARISLPTMEDDTGGYSLTQAWAFGGLAGHQWLPLAGRSAGGALDTLISWWLVWKEGKKCQHGSIMFYYFIILIIVIIITTLWLITIPIATIIVMIHYYFIIVMCWYGMIVCICSILNFFALLYRDFSLVRSSGLLNVRR